MSMPGKYRFTLQWGAETAEKIRAGDFLGGLGNRKSELVVLAVTDYLDTHPELLACFTKWMDMVVTPAAYDYLRRRNHRRQSTYGLLPPETVGREDQLPASGKFEFTDEKLSAAFSGLSMLRRQLLTLIFVEGLSAQETADKLSCSVVYVYRQKHRILKKLRDQLLEGGDGYGK